MKKIILPKPHFTLTEIIISLLFLTILKITAYSTIIDNENDLIIPQNETYQLKGIRKYNNSVKIDGTLSVIPYDPSIPESGGLELYAYSIEIGLTGKIDATGKGYRADEGPGCGIFCPVQVQERGGLQGAGGGGYGGVGKEGQRSGGGKIYGNMLFPIELGSGGGSVKSYGYGGYVSVIAAGGNGGGKIKIETK